MLAEIQLNPKKCDESCAVIMALKKRLQIKDQELAQMRQTYGRKMISHKNELAEQIHQVYADELDRYEQRLKEMKLSCRQEVKRLEDLLKDSQHEHKQELAELNDVAKAREGILIAEIKDQQATINLYSDSGPPRIPARRFLKIA